MPAASAKASKRPSAEDRRETILDAAGKVFFEQGFSGASVDSVIEIIGGSKRTIYGEFGNKEGLFIALVNRCAERVVGEVASDLSDSNDIRETMILFGRRLLETYQTADLTGIYRIILLEAERFPDLARTVYEKGAGRAAKNLADALKRAKSQGDISTTDCAAVANHFVGMIRGNEYLRVVLGLRGKIVGREADAFVKSAVDMCMYGIAAPDEARRAHKRSRQT
jgi:AcrR family transcriptional regulator